MFADELAKMEAKLKEQLKINDNLKLQLAAEEDRYKVGGAERRCLSEAGRPVSPHHHLSPPIPPSHPHPDPILDVAALAQAGRSL